MPTSDPVLWAMFVLVGLSTFLPRSSFIVAGHKVRLPSELQRALRYAPAAALAGLVVPDVVLAEGSLQLFNPKLAAVIAVVAVVTLSRNPWLPLIAGMAVLAGSRLI